jgi:HK97 family phage major capsid protein
MRLQALRAQATQALADMMALSEVAADRAYTAEEAEKFKALEAKHEGLLAEIVREERLEATKRAAAAAQGDRVDPDQAAAAASAKAAGVRVEVGKDLTQDDPKKGFRTHRDFLSSVMQHGRGRQMDTRLKPLYQAAAGSDEHGVYDAGRGGFLVPEAFSPNPLQLQPEDDPIAGRTRPFPMSAPIVKLNARVDKNHTTSVSGGLTVTRRPETVAATSSRLEFEQVTLNATSLFGLAFATEEVMQDSPVSFVSLIASSFSQEFGAKGVDERLNGSGVGEPEGILVSPALVSVPKEAGQTADTINYDNVKKMRSRVWGYGRAVWMANHDTMPDMMSLVQIVGTGGAPVYQPSAQEDRPDLLLGRPIFYTEYCKTLGDLGDIICANWFEYLDGTYQPLQSAESMHVRFVEHERAFKFWTRNDGRGWWKSALTPKNSTKTLSPFVALAARA